MTKSKVTDADIDRLLILFAQDQRRLRAEDDVEDFPEADYDGPLSPEDEAAADRFMQRLAAARTRTRELGFVVRRFREFSSVEDFAARFGLSPVDVLTLEAAALPLEPRDEATATRTAELTGVQPLKILRVLRAMRAHENVDRDDDCEAAPLFMAARKPWRNGDDDG
jgi:hypothetical protein